MNKMNESKEKINYIPTTPYTLGQGSNAQIIRYTRVRQQ